MIQSLKQNNYIKIAAQNERSWTTILSAKTSFGPHEHKHYVTLFPNSFHQSLSSWVLIGQRCVQSISCDQSSEVWGISCRLSHMISSGLWLVVIMVGRSEWHRSEAAVPRRHCLCVWKLEGQPSTTPLILTAERQREER